MYILLSIINIVFEFAKDLEVLSSEAMGVYFLIVIKRLCRLLMHLIHIMFLVLFTVIHTNDILPIINLPNSLISDNPCISFFTVTSGGPSFCFSKQASEFNNFLFNAKKFSTIQ